MTLAILRFQKLVHNYLGDLYILWTKLLSFYFINIEFTINESLPLGVETFSMLLRDQEPLFRALIFLSALILIEAVNESTERFVREHFKVPLLLKMVLQDIENLPDICSDFHLVLDEVYQIAHKLHALHIIYLALFAASFPTSVPIFSFGLLTCTALPTPLIFQYALADHIPDNLLLNRSNHPLKIVLNLLILLIKLCLLLLV